MKKAQAAMEFLMTYGWALLIILIAIGALAYFGVLNPSKLLPDTCIVPSGKNCIDFSITAVGNQNVQILALNSVGNDLTGIIMALKGDLANPSICGPNVTQTGAPLTIWKDGAMNNFVFDCPQKPSAGSRFRSDVVISYSKGSIRHNYQGRILGTVE